MIDNDVFQQLLVDFNTHTGRGNMKAAHRSAAALFGFFYEAAKAQESKCASCGCKSAPGGDLVVDGSVFVRGDVKSQLGGELLTTSLRSSTPITVELPVATESPPEPPVKSAEIVQMPTQTQTTKRRGRPKKS